MELADYDTFGALGVSRVEPLTRAQEWHLDGMSVSFSAYSATHSSGPCLASVTRREKGRSVYEETLVWHARGEPDTPSLTEVFIHLSAAGQGVGGRQVSGVVGLLDRIYWGALGFRLMSSLGEVVCPGVAAVTRAKRFGRGSASVISRRSAFSVYVAERVGVRFLCGEIGRARRTVDSMTPVNPIHIVLPVPGMALLEQAARRSLA